MRLSSVFPGRTAVYAAAFTILTAGITAISLQTRWVSNGFVRILESSVNKYLDATPGLDIYSAKIGSVGTPGLFGSEAKAFEIQERISGIPVFETASIKIKYSPFRFLLSRGDYSHAISGIELIKPKLTVKKDSSGQWNIARLFAGGKSGEPGFLTNADLKIGIRRGQLRIYGLSPLNKLNIALNGSIGLQRGDITFHALDVATLRGKAGIDGRLALVDGKESRVIARLDGFKIKDAIERVDLQGIAPITGDLNGMIKVTGRYPSLIASYKLGVKQGAVYLPKVGSTTVSKASLEGDYKMGSRAVSVRRAIISSGTTGLRLSGKVGLSGNLGLAGSMQTTKLQVDLPGVARMLHWESGRLFSRISINGFFGDPKVNLRIGPSSCLVAGIPVTNIQGSVKLDKASAEFQGSSAQLYGQTVFINGNLIYSGNTPSDSRVYLRAPRIAIARVAEGLGYKDIGYGDIALATSLSRSSDGFVLEGNGDSRMMNIRGIRLDRINFNFVGTPEGIRVSNGTASLADGTLGYKGNISSNGLLDIGVQSNELQLAPLTALLNSLDSIGISGVASGYTHVNGSIKRPKLAGGVSVYDLTVAKRNFNSLNFKYTWAGNKLGLNQIKVNDPEAVYSGDASVLLPVRDRAAAKLRGDFTVKGQSLSELLSIVSGSPISTALLGERFNGKVNGRIRLSGDTRHPVISVAMGPNGVVQPIPLSARIDLEYRDGRMRVSGIEPFKG